MTKISKNWLISFTFIICQLSFSAALTSCNELDEAPDNRTEIDNVEKVQKLLTSAYPNSVPAVICELSSDNLVDNNVVLNATHNSANQKFHDEAYQWADINNYSLGAQDTPYDVWERYYYGIAECNHAIAAMEEMSANPKEDADLRHSWGEAHVLRAYLHFVLLNVFAETYKDETQSMADPGIPYVTVPEEVVKVDYSQPEWRKSVAECYRLMEKDLLEGIGLIDDSKYTVPAFHFNRNAANAFAARLYLFWRKYDECIKYADAALGANPASILRNWNNISQNTMDTRLMGYNDEKAACNFLMQTTYSIQDRMLSACRYCINKGYSWGNINGKDSTRMKSMGIRPELPQVQNALSVIYNGGGPNWSGYLPAYDGNIFIFGRQEYGVWLFRVYEYFEYTDKIAGIGYVHMIYQPFTAEETLLCRAEAKLYNGDMDGAISDLGLWTAGKGVTAALNIGGIRNKYHGTAASNDFVSDIHPQEISTQFKQLTEDETLVLQCILHFRRIETMFEGMRWFDIKRYGITVHHAYRGPSEDDTHHDYLLWNDKRRVLQIPNNVITAGFDPTDRGIPAINTTGSMQTKPILFSTK